LNLVDGLEFALSLLKHVVERATKLSSKRIAVGFEAVRRLPSH